MLIHLKTMINFIDKMENELKMQGLTLPKEYPIMKKLANDLKSTPNDYKKHMELSNLVNDVIKKYK